MSDTIFAVASGTGRSAVALIRISGPESTAVIQALAGRVPADRVASYCILRAREDKRVLDRAIVTLFRGPASYTGEDQLELSLHGGVATVRGVLKALAGLGLRPALPGEFTRRAFEHGKLDLTEAEAVADLVDAETESQRDQAMLQLGGGLTRRQEGWRAKLIQAAAFLEAQIDFPDEDLPPDLLDVLRAPLEELRTELVGALADHRGEQVREGYRVALLGAPNAGKSSVMNGLLGRDAVIVTDIPGTTRDVVEASLDVEGYRVIVADMAGLRSTVDVVEKEGIRRALTWASTAALRLLIVDRSTNDAEWHSGRDMIVEGDILVLNKKDRSWGAGGLAAAAWARTDRIATVECQADSALLTDLTTLLAERVVSALASGEESSISRGRHRAAIGDALAHLDWALEPKSAVEMVAEDIRLASRALERLVGRVDTETVLDHVFSSFCIGK